MAERKAAPAAMFRNLPTAVVRIAVYVESETAIPRLLFASVSLLTRERPVPRSSRGVDRFPLASGTDGVVCFRRLVLHTDQALEWYRSVPSENFYTPVPFEADECDPKQDGVKISISDLADDPLWPALGLPTGSNLLSNLGDADNPAPFIGSGSAPARIHRRLGDGAGLDAIQKDRACLKFLKRRLHIDLADYAEYLGGLALIIPNPILRDVQHYFVPGSKSASERLVFRLIPRPGQTAEGLNLTVLERRSNLLSRFETITVGKSNLIEMDEQAPVEASGYVIAHQTHGVLVHQPPVHFIRSVRVTTNVVGPKGVERFSKDEGDPPPVSAKVRIVQAEMRRSRKAEAERYQQTWLDDTNREEALLRIRSRVFRAESRVILSAPTARPNLALDFLRSFPATAASVDVIVPGSMVLTEGSDQSPTSPAPSDQLRSPIVSLSQRAILDEFRYLSEISLIANGLRKDSVSNFSVYVAVITAGLPTETILCIDDAAWILGNIFRSNSSRPSLLMGVPDAEPILRSLGNAVKTSLPLAPYLRQLSRHLPSEEG